MEAIIIFLHKGKYKCLKTVATLHARGQGRLQ